MDSIYLDNSASTPMLPEVWEAMRPFCCERFANPASSHGPGRHARQALEDARARIASLVDAQPGEVVFTSGATEANNLALFGLAGDPPGRIAISAVEHPSVFEPAGELVRRGFSLACLPVDSDGVLDPKRTRLPDELRLLSVQLANHETGVIQPVAALVSLLDAATDSTKAACVHCDAAAAAGKMPVSFRQLGVTSLTISAHKFHGPKGIGALVVKRNAGLRPLFLGGHQQHANRPGTEPVALAVGMAAALTAATQDMEENAAKVAKLRRLFLEELAANAAPIVVNGSQERFLPHTVNVSFPGCKADVLLIRLDLAGVACSTGSACSSGSLLPSPVLGAMHVSDTRLHSAMRFSFTPLIEANSVREAAHRISKTVNDLRLIGGQESGQNP